MPPAVAPTVGTLKAPPARPPSFIPAAVSPVSTAARASCLFDLGLSSASPKDFPALTSSTNSLPLPRTFAPRYKPPAALPTFFLIPFPITFASSPKLPKYPLALPAVSAAALPAVSAAALAVALTSAVTASFVALAAGLEATDFNLPLLALGALASAGTLCAGACLLAHPAGSSAFTSFIKPF